jgi:hypothetical protein
MPFITIELDADFRRESLWQRLRGWWWMFRYKHGLLTAQETYELTLHDNDDEWGKA